MDTALDSRGMLVTTFEAGLTGLSGILRSTCIASFPGAQSESHTNIYARIYIHTYASIGFTFSSGRCWLQLKRKRPGKQIYVCEVLLLVLRQ